MRVCEFVKNGVFWNFYSIDYGHAFSILFKASNPIINSKKKFHRESIKHDYFCGLNLIVGRLSTRVALGRFGRISF